MYLTQIPKTSWLLPINMPLIFITHYTNQTTRYHCYFSTGRLFSCTVMHEKGSIMIQLSPNMVMEKNVHCVLVVTLFICHCSYLLQLWLSVSRRQLWYFSSLDLSTPRIALALITVAKYPCFEDSIPVSFPLISTSLLFFSCHHHICALSQCKSASKRSN